MSRIGRMPITVPSGVEVKIADGNFVTVKGPKGTLEKQLHNEMILKQDGSTILVERPSEQKKHKALHGLTRTLLNNMVVGVSEGFKKELEINGVGYRAQKQGKKLVMNLGYSHQVEMEESVSFPIFGIEKSPVSQSTFPLRTRSLSAARTNRLSASLRLRSGKRDCLNLIKARVSSMRMNISDAKKVRPERKSKGVRNSD